MSKKKLEIGDSMPHFIICNENRLPVDLSQIRGKYYIVYFYPKDDTPFCILEALCFSDAYEKLHKEGIMVFGVSSDTPDTHLKFKKKYNLPFSLLADTNNELRDLLGVPYNLFGLLPGRVTYLFNPNGILVHIIKSQFSPSKHVKEIFTFIDNINNS